MSRAPREQVVVDVERGRVELGDNEGAHDRDADFLAAVCHELRAPLTPLKGFLEMIADGQIDLADETQRAEVVEIMLRQTARLERLVTDLLDAAAVEHGTLAVEAEAVDLVAIASEQVDEIRQIEPDRDVELVSGEGCVAFADPVRTAQVVSNLLSNAMKYSPSGSPIQVRVASDGIDVVLSVTDRGDGIPEEELGTVFQSFRRGTQHSSRGVPGTGMGLYIARQLVEAMGGELSVWSEPDEGSTFWFTLPVATSRLEVEVVTARRLTAVEDAAARS